ncbi:MAG TPA: acyl-CoA dehydrogenase family protein [Acidimicrobiales bacterium]|nr:acyl-CoA dehydrogenase family protein [Acidimicrobiales bacterium]
MDLRLTDDQQLFHETTRKFLESTCPLETVRQLADGEPAGYERGWWKSGTALGWTSLLVTEEDGGGSVSGHGLLDLVLVAEEMGRLVSPGPLMPVNVVTEALCRSGTDEQRRQVLPGLLDGASIASWCWGAPAAGIDTGGAVRVTPTTDGFIIDGVSGPTEGGAEADVHLVTVVTTAGPTQLLVPSNHPGVRAEKMHSLDLVRRYAKVSFDHVEVPREMVIGEVGGAAGDVEHQLQTAVVLQCAEMAGAVERVFEFTVEYATDRYSFGRPLVSYQALKHRFADLKTWLEASLATAGAAARSVDTASKSAAELVSVAKAYIGERGPAILQDCVQLHGGIGVTWDHDLHLYLRRVMVDVTQLGMPREHRERVAVSMGMGEVER